MLQNVNRGKWRHVPSQEQFEIIRSKALRKCFECKNGYGEPRDVDVEGDTTRLLLEDHLHGLPKPLQGFRRIVLRRENCKRTDVYYVTPQRKKLRSCKVDGFIKDNELEVFTSAFQKALYSYHVSKLNTFSWVFDFLFIDRCKEDR
ncbi:methyl-CpG-binding domain-containing protein 3-like [Eutrema salsugineum]|uniref:methyl-CpG-binding domain-containing protein 3-like n=1 Tax=Eutrema salsugineum TaxID=72664 RepID=UPI000CED1463|nr:methyl-CpG-binding domain-containing protein 3-like [Eutrema salsugineum]